MSELATDAQGTTLKIGDAASPEVFTAISEVTDISGPGGSAQVKDVTDLASTRKEKKMGLPDEGQITFTCFFIYGNTQHELLETRRAARTLTNFQLTIPTSPVTTKNFSGYVIATPKSFPTDGDVSANITIEISGAIT